MTDSFPSMEDWIQQMETRVTQILETCPPEVARKRIEGYLNRFYMSQYIKSSLAQLYYDAGEYVLAGKLWYFEQTITPEKQMCKEEFKKAWGHDMEHILQELIPQVFRSPKYLDSFTKKTLLSMMEQLKEEKGYLPRFTLNWYEHLFARKADFM